MATKVNPNAPQKIFKKLDKFRFMTKIGSTDSVLKFFNQLFNTTSRIPTDNWIFVPERDFLLALVPVDGEGADEGVDVHMGLVCVDEGVDREEVVFAGHGLGGGHGHTQLPVCLPVQLVCPDEARPTALRGTQEHHVRRNPEKEGQFGPFKNPV